MTVFGCVILIRIDFTINFYRSIFSLVSLVWFDKRYQTLKKVFDHIFKHLEFPQKYTTARRNATLFSD